MPTPSSQTAPARISTAVHSQDLPSSSLGELRGSVALPSSATPWRRFAAFLGPGYLVATGYMDPGNWATALAGGSQFGAALLFVAVASSLMAMVLQALSARLGIATGRDLAQICRDNMPAPVSVLLWLVAEAAIIATDLAEVIGTAIGLQLVLAIPLWIGVILTGLDVLLVLTFQRFGFRKLEAFVFALLALIALAFVVQLALAKPDIQAVLGGLVPTSDLVLNGQMLYLALGIVGATVMPHNLFLHSGVVQTRAIGPTLADKREAIRFATIDSNIALVFAMLVNAAILILAAAAFYAHGHTDVVELQDAYRLIAPLLGAPIAATLFGVALIACGLNSALTATLAGQIVMEGFLRIRLSPAARRLLTRLIAIVPAIAVTLLAGEAATGRLLIGSQVVLSAALPFAMVPLVWLTASRRIMGPLVASRGMSLAAALIAAAIIALNGKLIWDAL